MRLADDLELRISRYALAMSSQPLPADVVEAAKIRIIDTVGCALGALDSPPAAALRRMSSRREVKGGEACDVWGSDLSVLPDEAAFVNGVACRYLDFNDIYLSTEACHPSDNIPAGWAVAQSQGCTGFDLIRAIAVGYQVHCRLADAASLRASGFDNVLYGALAASVMAGVLLHLTEAELAEALRIAATSSVPLLQTRVGELSMWKGMAAAHAARNGVFASLLARHGVTGPRQAFEGTSGLRAVVAPEFHLQGLESGGAPAKILDTRIKPYAAQYFLQTVIECAARLRSKVALENISAVNVETFDYAFEVAANDPEKWRPTTRETADHSLPYCVAVALMYGTVQPESFAQDRLEDPVTRHLMSKVKVAVNDSLTRKYPECTPAVVAIATGDGSVLSEAVDIPLGHPARPLNGHLIEDKFLALAYRLGADDARDLLDELGRLELLSELPPIARLSAPSGPRG